MKVAILGAGHIAQKMAKTLFELSKSTDPSMAEINYAVASRDLAKAQAFAKEWSMAKAYGSYEEMVADPEVDLVYVATPHSHHHAHVRLALEHGKNVLCEKAFMTTAAEAEEVIALARENGLLLAEGMWIRYMPFAAQIRSIIESGKLGKVHSLTVSLGYPIADVPRIYRPELGGGTLLDLGCYTINFARMYFGSDIVKIDSSVVMSDTGVDLQEAITFTYADGRMACLHATGLATNDRQGVICGDKAFLLIDNINNPLNATLCDRNSNVLERFAAPEQINGFEYQVLECKRCIEAGRVETESMPHAETLAVMQIMDRLRKEWGVIFPADK